MAADELDPEPLETELALAAQLQDQPFVAFQDLAYWGAVRPAVLLLQPGCALGLVAAPPLAQCRAGDPAAAAGHTGVARLPKELEPAQPCRRIERWSRSSRWPGERLARGRSRQPGPASTVACSKRVLAAFCGAEK